MKYQEEKTSQNESKIFIDPPTQAAMEPVHSNHSTPPTYESRQDIFKTPEELTDSLWQCIQAKNARTALIQIENATLYQQYVVANDNWLMNNMMARLPTKERNCIADILYHLIDDTGMLIRLVDIRFGIRIGSAQITNPDVLTNVQKIKRYQLRHNQEIEAPWTKSGVIRLYGGFLKLPQKDLREIKAILAIQPENASLESISGEAHTNKGIVGLRFNDELLNNKEDGEFTEPDAEQKYGKADTSIGTNIFDFTTAHEFGHIIDRKHGYSARKDFRKISGWQEHSHNDLQTLTESIRDSLKNPYPDSFSAQERKLCMRCAEDLIRQHPAPGNEGKAIQYAITRSLNATFEFGNTYSGRPLSTIRPKIAGSGLIMHIRQAFAESMPWLNGELFPDMKRQIHESYRGENWFSYRNSAWTSGKISKYQFRNPEEEFAELYASYHTSEKKGEKTPKQLRKWFEMNVK